MNIKDRLQINIVTYNRDIYLDRTLHFLTDEGSPVRDFDICILDNNSNDNTDNVIKSFQEKFPNIKHIKHVHNIGGNANITRAFEINTKDYVWVLGDSYFYDWTNWGEIEDAINNNEPVIVATRDAIPDDNKTIAAVLAEAGFLSACIYSKESLDGEMLRLMYDNVYSWFPHLIPLVNFANNKGVFYIPEKGIVHHGAWTGQLRKKGYDGIDRELKPSKLYFKSETMSYIVGMSIVLSKLEDDKLKKDTFEALYQSLTKLVFCKNPYKEEVASFALKRNMSQLGDLYTYLKSKHCKNIDQYIISQFSLWQLFVNLFFRLKPNKFVIKYNFYKVLQNITFGSTREKMREKKHKYKNRIF